MNQQVARALIAEDEPILAAALTHALQRLWPELDIVATCPNGVEALRQGLALQPDILFLDIKMPGKTGLEAAEELAEQWPHGTPFPHIVFVTAYDEYALAAFEHAAADYVLKPVNDARLGKTVDRLRQRLRDSAGGNSNGNSNSNSNSNGSSKGSSGSAAASDYGNGNGNGGGNGNSNASSGGSGGSGGGGSAAASGYGNGNGNSNSNSNTSASDGGNASATTMAAATAMASTPATVTATASPAAPLAPVAPSDTASASDANMARLLAQLQAMLPPAPRLHVIRAAVGNSVRMIALADVVYFEALDKYINVVCRDSEALIRTSLKELLPQLDPQQFWQIHRGTIVNASAIASAVRDDAGKLSLTLRQHPAQLRVSPLYAHLFRQM